MIYSGIDKRIKELRKQKGLTQSELASLSGISKSVISSYENAVHQPPYDILIKMSKLFGVTSDYLIGNTVQRTLSIEGLTETQIQSLEMIVQELRKMNTMKQ